MRICLMDRNVLTDKVLKRETVAREETPAVLQAAYRIRKNCFGKKVSLHVLRNAESGVEQYGMQSGGEIVAGARDAESMQALRYCVVTSSRAPSEKEMDVICAAAQKIKVGFLTEEKARRLKESGVDRLNHNLETSGRFYPSIGSAHNSRIA